MEPILHTGNAVIIAVGEEAIYRTKKTSLPHHIRVKIAVPVGKTRMKVYVYRKKTGKIIVTGELEKINPLGEFEYEYKVTNWKNLRKHLLVSELDSDDIAWIIDAENGIAAVPEVKLAPLKYLWVKPDRSILSDKEEVVQKQETPTLAPYLNRRKYRE